VKVQGGVINPLSWSQISVTLNSRHIRRGRGVASLQVAMEQHSTERLRDYHFHPGMALL